MAKPRFIRFKGLNNNKHQLNKNSDNALYGWEGMLNNVPNNLLKLYVYVYRDEDEIIEAILSEDIRALEWKNPNDLRLYRFRRKG